VCAAALANLDLFEREGVLERARELEGEIAQTIGALADHELVSEVRTGTGVLAAVQLEDPALAERATAAARERGVLTRGLLGGALQISPPLVIERSDLEELAEKLAGALDACTAALTPAT
jgi:adenosylmethionine-8-amino-7-oxononanoate aminotransferase